MYQLLLCFLYTVTDERHDSSTDLNGFSSYTTEDIGGNSTSKDSYKQKT